MNLRAHPARPQWRSSLQQGSEIEAATVLDAQLQPRSPAEGIVNCASAAGGGIKPKKIMVGEQHQTIRCRAGCNPTCDRLQGNLVIGRPRVVEHIGDNDEIIAPSGWVEAADIALPKHKIDVTLR